MSTLLSFGIILLAAKLCTNAVEWLGYKLKLPEAFGSVVAATGTALLETIIPVVAVINDAGAQRLFTGTIQTQRVARPRPLQEVALAGGA